jgi:hypothetical protein
MHHAGDEIGEGYKEDGLKCGAEDDERGMHIGMYLAAEPRLVELCISRLSETRRYRYSISVMVRIGFLDGATGKGIARGLASSLLEVASFVR